MAVHRLQPGQELPLERGGHVPPVLRKEVAFPYQQIPHPRGHGIGRGRGHGVMRSAESARKVVGASMEVCQCGRFWRGTRRLRLFIVYPPLLKLAPAQDGADAVATPGLVHPPPPVQASSRQKHELLAKSSPLSQSPDIVPRVWPSNTQRNPYHPAKASLLLRKTRPPIWNTCSTALHHQRLACPPPAPSHPYTINHLTPAGYRCPSFPACSEDFRRPPTQHRHLAAAENPISFHSTSRSPLLHFSPVRVQVDARKRLS
ncbi:hypothetical protein B0I37DRAFT_174554 [Chaetomium sp. MPI-CAGE-AT-0009]|nr:hypothetical protein B0I37DRAFT_174554 [Chaetomium sp. MPI-CAGE-AT-0009]